MISDRFWRRLSVRALVLAAGLAFAPWTHAAEPGDKVENIEELNLEDLLGTVSAASRTEESALTAPATVTVLDQDDIINSGATTVPDLLRKVPGVQVLELAPGDYLVSLRGTGGVTGNNVVVLLDNIPLNSRVDGNVDWGGLPVDLSQIDRIEIVRGPVSTIYGPDAYTGVIAITTQAASSDKVAATAHVAAGVDVTGKPIGVAAASVSGTRGKVSGRLNASGRYDSTFSSTSGADQPAWARGGADAHVQYDPTKDVTLSLDAMGNFDRRSGLDHLALQSLAQDTTTAFAQARLVIRDLPSVLDSLEVWERLRYFQTDAHGQLTGFSYNQLRSRDEETGFDLRFEFPYQLKIALGANAGVEEVEAPFIHPLENAKLRGRYGFYINGNIELWKSLSASAAFRGDDSALLNGMHFAGRGSLVYHRNRWALRLTAGSAYRDPTYVEVAGRFIDPQSNLILLEGTPGLNAPQITAFELGAILLPHSTVTVKPTVYVAELSNLMVENFEPLVRKTFANETASRWLLGAELEVAWKPRKELSLEGNVAAL
ncbi:MAG TPA: TonB-dependent receptor plug domain-containing protein, partial [Polyangia bacterium]